MSNFPASLQVALRATFLAIWRQAAAVPRRPKAEQLGCRVFVARLPPRNTRSSLGAEIDL